MSSVICRERGTMPRRKPATCPRNWLKQNKIWKYQSKGIVLGELWILSGQIGIGQGSMIPCRLGLLKKDSSLYGLVIVDVAYGGTSALILYCTCFTKFPKLYYFVLKERWLLVLGIYTVQYNHFIFHGTCIYRSKLYYQLWLSRI
jgi:hypothetical protein